MLNRTQAKRPATLALAALIIGGIGWAGSTGTPESATSATANPSDSSGSSSDPAASASSSSTASGSTSAGSSSGGQVEAAELRDPWLRPFTSTSIWNMPIGSSANYRSADLPYTSSQALETSYLMQTTESDPVRPLIKVGGWRDRCSGTEQLGTIHLPNGWQPKAVEGRATPNNPGVFLQPDGRTLVNVGTMQRCDPNGALYANRPGTEKHITDLYGDGRYGAHGASRLSQLGGAIRPGELNGDEPIAHALDLLVWSEHLYWGGTKESSYRWPASSSDAYAGPDRYRGSNNDVRMGSLLAIAPGATPEDLGLTTDVGRKLFDALQNYGAYVTDDTAWNANYIGVDSEAIGTFPWGDAEKADMARMVASLSVITNNGPDNIGGGGDPRRPLLPELDGSAPVVPSASGSGSAPEPEAANDPEAVSDPAPAGDPEVVLDPLVEEARLSHADRVDPPVPAASPAPTVPPTQPTPPQPDPGPVGDVIWRDLFDGPDGQSLETRTNPKWSVIGGDIETLDRAAVVTTSRGATMALADAGTADVVVESSITLSPGRAAPGLAVRASESGDGLVLSMVIRDGQNRVSLHAVRDGRYTLLAEADDVDLERGASYDVALWADGSSVGVELDGRLVLDHQLSAELTSAFGSNHLHGLRIMSNSVADDGQSRWNDVVISGS